jgi:hypothetical protein
MNFCNNGGYLIGANYWLPTELTDYFRASHGIGVIGCNSVICSQCNQSVQHALEGTGRRYQCGCETYMAYGGVYLDTSSDSDPDPVPAWQCAGHPLFVSPGTIAGVQLDGVLDWSQIVAAHIVETTNLHRSIDHVPGFSLTRIFQALQEECQRTLAMTVGSYSKDTSLLVRQSVALFFVFNRKAPGLELVLDAWRDEPTRYDDHPSAFGPDSTLRENLLDAIGARIIGHVSESPLMLETWRWAALRGSGLGAFLHTAKIFDSGWLAEHLEVLFDLAPADWFPLIRAVSVESPMRLVLGCRRAIAEGYATREEVAAALMEQYDTKAEGVIAALG